jgi:hypothetical protein
MGDLRFTVPPTQDFDPRVWETAYITGIEGIPWHCHHSLDGQQFNIGREIDESGKLNIVWPTQSFGNLCLSTTSLRLAQQPYDLAVEIARGTVSRLRNQTSEWQRVGLRLPDKFFPMAEDALSQFLRAVTCTDNPNKRLSHAQRAIDLSIEAAVLLCNTFAAQSLEARRQGEGRLSTLLGIELSPEVPLASVADALQKAFNLVCIPAHFGHVHATSNKPNYDSFDPQVDWALETNKKLCIGPLVNFRSGGLPQWMVMLDESYENILNAACEYARATVERYRGRAHIWNAAAGLNIPSELDWSDEEVLRMAVSLIETVRRADDRCPVLLTVDQPWSEYLRDDPNGISPLHFADALIRADLGLSGLALELNMDTWPGGSFPRDPIEVNRLIDRWSMLGLPLMIILSSPTEAVSANSPTPGPDSVPISAWRTSPDSSGIVAPDSLVRLLLSKPSVHALIWNDSSSPNASTRRLWSPSGTAKPLLTSLAALRKGLLH